MTDQTVPSLTDRLAAYMVEAFLDSRGYDPGDKIDVEVTLKEGFHAVLTEMRGPRREAVTWEGLSPPYGTIVADPPWRYEQGGPRSSKGAGLRIADLPYSTMTVDDIAAMPVAEIAADASHLYVWTTNAYLERVYDIARAWGFRPSQLLTWCKPLNGVGPGGAFANTTEFCLFARRNCPHLQRIDSTWWKWPRGRHSEKPPAFLDMVERVSPGPYVELFARAPRLGWDHWGHGYEIGATA